MPTFTRKTYLALLSASTLVFAGPIANNIKLRAAPDGWTSLGCIIDEPGHRTLNAASTVNDNLTVEACVDFCSEGGFTYSGVEFGKECFCDYSYQNLGDVSAPDEDCSSPCTGDETEFCGGFSRLNVFWNGSPDPLIPAGNGEFTYAGCFTDDAPPRSLEVRLDVADGVDAASCVATCAAAGYTIAGTEYGQECWCGNELNESATQVNDAECTIACVANPSEFCGASFRLTVLTDFAPPPPEPTDTEVPEPTNTDTPEPTSTETPEPTDTEAPEPTETGTAVPEPTNTDTDTPEPTETDTNVPEPTETETDAPAPTETGTDIPAPTETDTDVPDSTDIDPTDLPLPTESETEVPEPTNTDVVTDVPESTAEAREFKFMW